MRMTHSLLMGARVSELAVVCWCIVAAVVAVVRPLGARGRRRVMGGALVLAVAALATTQSARCRRRAAPRAT